MKEPVKREPVKREPVINIDVPHENDDWIHNITNIPTDVQPEAVAAVKSAMGVRPLPPLDEDGWRQCARKDCGATFAPEPASRAFCSDACAQINFYREHGMADKAEALMAGEKRDEDGNLIHKRSASEDPEKEAKKDTRYGPLREIERVLSESGGRKRVVFKVCHHEASVKSDVKRSRCRTCRNAAAKGVEATTESKSVKKRLAVQREPVQREPVTMETAEEFVKRGQAAQKAVDAAIKKETKKLVKRKPVAKRKPVKRAVRKPIKKGKGKR